MTAHCLRFCSTASAAEAPRESASSENTPLPAKRSRKRAPAIRALTMLKYAWRARSEVGRTSPAGTGTRRPRNAPPVMRSCAIRVRPTARSADAKCEVLFLRPRRSGGEGGRRPDEGVPPEAEREIPSPSLRDRRLADEVVRQVTHLHVDGRGVGEAFQLDDSLI